MRVFPEDRKSPPMVRCCPARSNVKPEIRKGRFADLSVGVYEMIGLVLAPPVMTVFAAPAPMRIMPLVIERVVSQVHDPAGTNTVSPGDAVLIIADTSVREQEAAMCVLAWAAETDPAITSRNTVERMNRLHIIFMYHPP